MKLKFSNIDKMWDFIEKYEEKGFTAYSADNSNATLISKKLTNVMVKDAENNFKAVKV